MIRLALFLACFALPLCAVEPDEVLSDAAMEIRARELSRGLRCLVCQNESIDESNASLARDLRLLVRERLMAGDTDEQVIAFIVTRYGEFVLLRPTSAGGNWLLWAAGPLMLLIGGGAGLWLCAQPRYTCRAVRPNAGRTRSAAQNSGSLTWRNILAFLCWGMFC